MEDLLLRMKAYIEEVELIHDAEWGMNREITNIEMPKLYDDILEQMEQIEKRKCRTKYSLSSIIKKWKMRKWKWL